MSAKPDIKDARDALNAKGPQAVREALTNPANFRTFQAPEPKPSDALDFSVLDARRIDLVSPPAKPVPILKLQRQSIATAGNIVVLAAQAKAGKSAVVGAMLAAFASDDVSSDCLGLEGAVSETKAVIHFDTEQSPYDAHQLVARAARKAGATTMPKNFRHYRLIDISTKQRRAFLSAEMDRASKECGGVHCVIVDGIADLCIDPNESAEAFGLVEEIARLAVQHECVIIVVLHENPGGQNFGSGKTRGHLGSQLERKAESNLRIVKEGEFSILYGERCRSAHIPKSSGQLFHWSEQEQMHVSVANVDDIKYERKCNAHRDACLEVFNGLREPLPWGDLKQRIMEKVHVKDRSAERRINEWQELGFITKDSTNRYQLKP